ncbi:hypothetical protein [Hyalangium sp.]|uniref:SitA5 family polymorphic toxin n=1 Tax=Hyalangium sp. TaxID=2028555 RepID=UPI002D5EFD6C|nr:hypothetical protein [Hyalangium sp.]HYH99114.1 hypothetical protein [Hyalangium sp.]
MAHRLTAVLMMVVLASACATTRVVRLDTGQGAPLEYRSPTSNKSVEVGADEFEEALTLLVLHAPLTLRHPQQGWLVRTSSSSPTQAPRWQDLARKGLGGLCKAGQPKDDCLSVLDDVMGFSQWDKLGIALGLSFDPMRESIAHAVQNTLAPQLFCSVLATGLVTWVFLAANPEPIFTKAAAIVSAVMLIYLGVDAFLAVLNASLELKRTTDRATTFEELQEASQRFARAVGPEVARVFVLATTVVVTRGMVGGAAWLASRLPMLPNFSEAATLGASQVGVRLSEVGQVSAVAVVEGNIVITLAPTAVAMGTMGSGSKGGSVSTQGSGTNLTTTRQSGGTTYRFNTGHGFNRAHRSGTDLRNTDLTPDEVENAIMDHLNAFRASGGALPTVSGGVVPQPYIGRVGVGGHTIGFSAVQTPGGTVSVGTYYLLP